MRGRISDPRATRSPHQSHTFSIDPLSRSAQRERELRVAQLERAPRDHRFMDGPPTKFLPQFGGYCAFALSKGRLSPVDPDVYKIVDGKLYMFQSAGAK